MMNFLKRMKASSLNRWIFRYGIGSVAVIYILWFANLDLISVRAVLLQTDLRLVVIAIVLAPLMVLVRAWRWQTILLGLNLTVSFWETLRITALGLSLGLSTPAQVGEFSRGYYLKKLGYPLGTAMASVVYDRLLDLMVYGLIGMLGLITFIQLPISALAIMGLGTLSIIGLFWILYKVPHVMEVFFHKLAQLLQKQAQLPIPHQTALRVALLKTLLVAVGQIAATVLLAQAIGIHISTVLLAVILAASALIRSLPISVAGIGTRDAFLMYTLAPYGITPTTAVGCSTLLLAYLVLNALLGVFFYTVTERRKS